MNFEDLPLVIDMAAPVSCMGGGCDSRQQCALFNALDRRNPQERLCGQLEVPAQSQPRRAGSLLTQLLGMGG